MSYCLGAIMHGHVDVLKWLIECGCRLNELSFQASIHFGKLEIAKWMYTECRERFGMKERWPTYLDCDSAEKGGHYDVLVWLHNIGCTCCNTHCELCKLCKLSA